MTEIDPKRSAMMARIGPRDTAPELAVLTITPACGARGKSDVVLPRHHTIFLIHGFLVGVSGGWLRAGPGGVDRAG